MNKFIDWLTRVPLWIGGSMMIGVILISVADVFARKFLSSGYIGLVDITQLAVIGFAYLSLPRAFSTYAHVAVELYDHRLSYRADHYLKAFALILSIGVLSLLLWYGWTQASRTLRYGDVSQNVEIPMIVYWGFLLCGVALSWLICVLQFFQALTGISKGSVDV